MIRTIDPTDAECQLLIRVLERAPIPTIAAGDARAQKNDWGN